MYIFDSFPVKKKTKPKNKTPDRVFFNGARAIWGPFSKSLTNQASVYLSSGAFLYCFTFYLSSPEDFLEMRVLRLG